MSLSCYLISIQVKYCDLFEQIVSRKLLILHYDISIGKNDPVRSNKLCKSFS